MTSCGRENIQLTSLKKGDGTHTEKEETYVDNCKKEKEEEEEEEEEA